MAIDRPAKPPDRPEPPATPDELATDGPAAPRPADPPSDPWGAQELTRAQAFESLRRKVIELDTQNLSESDQPLTSDRDVGEPPTIRSDEPPSPGSVDEPGGHHDYWTEVPRFFRLWETHEEQWPAGPPMRPDQPAEAELPTADADSMAQVAEAEPMVSADVTEIASGVASHGWLEGFEFRLKGEDRLREKISSARASSSPDATVSEIIEQIPDAIRYTFCFGSPDYTRGYLDIRERLEERGYHIYKSKNSWSDAEYKGINTRWVTPEGQRFEVQFHTPESFHAKHEVTHEAYERIRDPATTANERRALSTFQREVSSWIPSPAGVFDVADYSEEGY